jgi:RHS repeat-associated protein
VGNSVWKRGLVAVVSAIVIFEAGANAPAFAISAQSSAVPPAVSGAEVAPQEPRSDQPDAYATTVTCDEFDREVADGLGAGPLGFWQYTVHNGPTSVSGGEASIFNQGYGSTEWYVDVGSVQPPFEILLEHRVWIQSSWDDEPGTTIVADFGLTEPGLSQANSYHSLVWNYDGAGEPPSRRLAVRPFIRRTDPNVSVQGDSVFEPDYVDGTEFLTRLRVVEPESLYLKIWYVGQPEPASWLSITTTNPPDGPFRYLFLEVDDWASPIADDPKNEWRIDRVCLDTAPPPVMLSEEIPPGTERNYHPNTETAGDPVNTFNGSLTTQAQDTVIPGRGPVIDFRRTYNSNDSRSGPMGPGWTHNYATRLTPAADESGDMYLIGPEGRSDRYTLETGGTFSAPAGIHSELIANPDGTFQVVHKDQSSWTFDTGGRLASIRDRYGNISNLTYGAGGRLVSISDPAGRGSLALAYTDGRLTSITDWASPARVVTYQYDGSGRLWKATDREGKTVTYAYDGTSSRIASITDPRGNVTLTNTYDVQGRVATQKDALGLTTGEATTYAYVVDPDGTRETTITAPPTSFESSFNPSLTDSYDADGWLVERITRPSSTETLTQSFTYDGQGNRTSATDARGGRTDFCYDVDYAGTLVAGSSGNLTRRIDPPPTTSADRPVTLIAYDATDNVIQTVAPEGVPSGGSVACSTDLSAISTAHAIDFTYDASGIALLSTTTRFQDPELGPQTAIVKYEYNDAANPGLITRLIPPRGNTGPSPDNAFATGFTYNTSGSNAGLLKDLTDPLGNRTSFGYDSVGRLTAIVDPLGNAGGGTPADHTTTLSYDKEDRLRFRTLPAPSAGGVGLTEETRYDASGNPVVRIDANGQVAAFGYDERNSLMSVTESPLAWTDPATPPTTVIATEYEYDAGGNVAHIIRAAGDSGHERATDYAYDGRGLLRREVQYPVWPSLAGALVTTLTYDPDGNRATATDPLGQTATFSYDSLSRLTGVDYSDPATADVGYAYDANGNRTSMTDGTGTTTYEFDEAGRLLSVTSPGPDTVGYRYDLDGNRAKLIYPDATEVTYAWNNAGRLDSLTDWASRSVEYAYAPDGLLRSATSPDGSVATYAYDNARRLVDVLHAGPSATVLDHLDYSLDAVGNVTALANGDLEPQFARPDGFIGSNGSWLGTYASTDEVTASDADFLASPSGPTTSNYYEVRLSDVVEPHVLTGITVRYRYAKNGNNSGKVTNLTAELRQGSTVIASQTHSNIPGVTGSGWQAGSITLTATQAGNITEFSDLRLRFRPSSSGGGQARSAQISWAELEFASEGDPSTLISYSYDRLNRLTGVEDAQGTESYSYDPVSNRLTAGGSTFAYDRADRLTAAGATSITVDANGNLTANGTDSFDFDQANRLTSAEVDGVTETYEYDGDGTRISRQVGSDPVIGYVSDVGAALPVTIADGDRKYVYGLGLAYAVSGNDIEVFHGDHLGSVRTLTNGAGAVIGTYQTDAWGVETQSTGSSTQPFGFTGEARDASGLSYLRSRYYDPALGRFLSRDTWAGGAYAPQSLNRFTYVGNNPVRYADPTGRCGIDLIADVGFSAFSLGQVIFGPEKERAENFSYLLLDVGGIFIPCGAGIGTISRSLRAASSADDAMDAARAGRLAPGPYAGQSIPARGSGRDFTTGERGAINSIGTSSGCHSCGTTTPGTLSGNFVPDHQPPTALNPSGGPQVLYPQCLACSRQQGLDIARLLGGR